MSCQTAIKWDVTRPWFSHNTQMRGKSYDLAMELYEIAGDNATFTVDIFPQ